MIRYKKYQNKNKESKAFGKWYGRAVHELVEFDEFITHMAQHHCAFSEATIRGVLIEMETCLRELLLEGKSVRFDELGIFSVGLATEGTKTSDEFTAAIYNEKKDKRGEKLAETEEDKLEARTDGSDAFDTLCIGVEKFIPAYTLQPSAGFTSFFGG